MLRAALREQLAAGLTELTVAAVTPKLVHALRYRRNRYLVPTPARRALPRGSVDPLVGFGGRPGRGGSLTVGGKQQRTRRPPQSRHLRPYCAASAAILGPQPGCDGRNPRERPPVEPRERPRESNVPAENTKMAPARPRVVARSQAASPPPPGAPCRRFGLDSGRRLGAG